MGNNLDLISLLGLPKKVKCPHCNNEVDTMFDDYDIECGNPEAVDNQGLLTLNLYCSICDNSNDIKFKAIQVK